MKTKCLIIDNETLARNLIREYIGKLDDFEIVAECCDAVQALTILRLKHVDLIFMDIQMPQICGIEFLKTLRNPPKVIITTTNKEHAIDAFELNVVDYLLKPVSFERFLKSINKNYLMNTNYYNIQQGAVSSIEKSAVESHIYIKENKKVIKVYLSEIKYIEGFGEYVLIFTTNRRIMTKTRMVLLLERLSNESFLRIHRSFIVSMDMIDAFTCKTIEIGGKELPIGKSFKNTTLNALKLKSMVPV